MKLTEFFDKPIIFIWYFRLELLLIVFSDVIIFKNWEHSMKHKVENTEMSTQQWLEDF